MSTTNDLQRWFDSYHTGPGVHKWLGYLDLYHRHFEKYRNQDKIVFVEVGVQSGGSIEMWKSYFGEEKLDYYGIDVDFDALRFSRNGVTIFIGDQSDPVFWDSIRTKIPPIDIFLDDGGHYMNQQILTLEKMFWLVKDGGVFACEDLHTSYIHRFGGGVGKATMIERCKVVIDQINARWSQDEQLKEDEYTRNVAGIHFYDSMVFIDKASTKPLEDVKRGDEWIPYKVY